MPSSLEIYTLETNLLGGGESHEKRTWWIWIGLVVGITISLVVLVVWMFRGQVFIPNTTALLISTTPHAAERALGSRREGLPEIWRTALSSSSRLPVLLGAYTKDEEWKIFAIIPRWRADEYPDTYYRKTQRGVALVGAEPLDGSNSQALNVSKQWNWASLLFGKQAVFWLQLQAFFSSESLVPDWLSQSSLIQGEVKDGTIQTDISFPDGPGWREPVQADLAFLFPAHVTGTGITTFFQHLSWGNTFVSELSVEPDEYRLDVDEQGKPIRSYLGFPQIKERLSLINEVLAGVGIYRQQLLSLPDGSVVYEKSPWLSANNTLLSKMTTDFGELQFEENGVWLTREATSTSSLFESRSCDLSRAVGLLSPQALSRMERRLTGRVSGLFASQAFLIVQDSKLAVCFQ